MHHWQDYVFTFGQIVFIVALIPSVVGKNKPALITSLTTGAVIALFSFTYATLTFWYSMTTTGLLALVWLYLGFQKYQQGRLTKSSRSEAARSD